MNKSREVIILAGGLGTRLQDVIDDIPKPMAPINGRPFLEYQLDYLSHYDINHIVFSVGYKYEVIQNHFGNKYKNISIDYAIEETPLGTGGAISLALQKISSENVLVINGDTFFRVNYGRLWKFHTDNNPNGISMVLRLVDNVERYGAVDADFRGIVRNFSEKGKKYGKGVINGGVYMINRDCFYDLNLPEICSFERDCLEIIYHKRILFGMLCSRYFIDIGIPEDYEKAQDEFLAFNDNDF